MSSAFETYKDLWELSDLDCRTSQLINHFMVLEIQPNFRVSLLEMALDQSGRNLYSAYISGLFRSTDCAVTPCLPIQ